MNILKEIARLTRIEHGLMFAAAVFIGEIITGTVPPYGILLLSILIPVFSEMGAFALNDYVDVEADRANKRTDRPLVAGTLSPRFALLLSISMLLLSSFLAYFINAVVFILTISLNILAIAYNFKLKELPLVGNGYIALTMGIPFIFGNFVVSQVIFPPNFVLFILAFIAGLAREIIKSVEDVYGDLVARGAKTLPILIGRKQSLAIAFLLYMAFIPLTYLPFVSGLRGTLLSYFFVTLGNTLIVANVFYALKGEYRKSRSLSLIAFFMGLLGYLIAAVL
ncbi:MAG: UbiA family prenyltransferase [Candidatus Bilamarchaeaceae archaeon]